MPAARPTRCWSSAVLARAPTCLPATWCLPRSAGSKSPVRSRPNRKLLLLDEVLTGLTPVEAKTGVELVRKVRDTGVTVLMVEHVMEIVMPLVDRAIVLDLGKVLVEGKPADVVRDQEGHYRLSGGSSCCRCMKSPPPIRAWSRSRRSRSKCQGRDRLRCRRQRGRQIDAFEIDRRRGASALRYRVVRRHAHRRLGAARHHLARHRLCAGKPPAVSAPVSARQSAARQLPFSRREQPRGTIGTRVPIVPAPAGAAGAARRDAVRRRTADAGDQPRADDAAKAPDGPA